MKTIGRLASLLLPFAVCGALFAQQNNSSHGRSSDPQPTASRGSATSPQQSHPISKSFVPDHADSASSNPHANQHPPRFHYNGGFAYYPYYYSPFGYAPYGYAPTPMPTGQTATDRLIENGGTFTRVDSAPGEIQPDAEAPRPNYSQPQPPVTSSLPATPVGSPLPTMFAGAVDPEANSTAVEESPAILVFADGHSLEISNYAVFGGSIIVLGRERRRIPLTQLDLTATIAANDKAGYTFRIPAVYLK